jgi:hypothetical protein
MFPRRNSGRLIGCMPAVAGGRQQIPPEVGTKLAKSLTDCVLTPRNRCVAAVELGNVEEDSWVCNSTSKSSS